MDITKQNLKNLIEPFVYDKLDNIKYEIKNIEAKKLLTWNRLDLAFRLFYLDNKNKCNELAFKVYYEVINTQTQGNFKEVGNEHKFDINEYIKEFDITYNDIKKNGFDKSKTIIPLSDSGTIINGAHRLCSAIVLEKNVDCIQSNSPIMIADYNYFQDRYVSSEILELAVSKFVEYAENTHIAFLWPSGIGSKQLAESKIPNIIYKKEITLSSNGGFNLLFELYKHMDWVGNAKNGYKGIQQKLIECFPNFEPVTIVLFQSDNIEKVRKIKDEVRQIYKIGYSSIHITDTKEESVRISRFLLNNNGIHFLNHGNPFKVKSLKIKLKSLKEFIENNNINIDNLVIDSSMLLSLYGLREASDIDYFLEDDIKVTKSFKDIEPHDEVLKYYNTTKKNLIYNPENYFYFNGFKFISFNNLFKMKKNRGHEKDRNDCQIMEGLLEKKSYKKNINLIRQKIFYLKLKFKYNFYLFFTKIIKYTKKYEFFRKIYIHIKSK